MQFRIGSMHEYRRQFYNFKSTVYVQQNILISITLSIHYKLFGNIIAVDSFIWFGICKTTKTSEIDVVDQVDFDILVIQFATI